MRLRAWAELITPEEALAPSTVKLLQRYQICLCLAVPHGTLGPPLERILRTYADAGLEVAPWLLLPKEIGYWPSERTGGVFEAWLNAVFAWAARVRVPIPWVAVDLELPIHQVNAWRESQGLRQALVMGRMALRNLDARRFQRALAQYRRVLDTIHGHGAKAICAAHDFMVEDFRLGAPIIQDFLETPVADVPWDVVSAMIYNSMVSELFHVSLADARYLQYDLGRELKQAFGERAGMSLGLTGVGVLGDEPHYHAPEELIRDVAVAKALGVEDIALFSLEGILRSSDPVAWLEPLLEVPPAIPPRTSWAGRERFKRRLLARGAGWIRHLPRLI